MTMETLSCPRRQNTPLGLAGMIQRNGNTSTSGTRLTAVATRKVLNTALNCLWGYTPDFLLGLSPLALSKTNGKPQGSGTRIPE